MCYWVTGVLLGKVRVNFGTGRWRAESVGGIREESWQLRMAVDLSWTWIAQAALIEKRSLPDNPGILAAAATRSPGISADKTGCHLAFSSASFQPPPSPFAAVCISVSPTHHRYSEYSVLLALAVSTCFYKWYLTFNLLWKNQKVEFKYCEICEKTNL